jgi:putative NIF3 family GTP cyclohydrolase 1 type 2
MTTARQIADLFESIAPLDSGMPGDELGFVYGDPGQEVRGIACTWIASAQSIQAAAQAGLNLIICHESLWLYPQVSPWYDGPAAEQVFSNNLRRELLDRHGITVYRSHSNWDALHGDGVPDQALAALSIPGLREVGRQKYFSVQELPEPRNVKWLYEQARRGLGFAACRIFGDGDKAVRRFAFLIGGFGENQLHMPQAARDLGAEAILIGEMSEFIVIACLEMGLPVVETLHSASEAPAIRRQAQILAERLPGLPVVFIPSGAAAMGR